MTNLLESVLQKALKNMEFQKAPACLDLEILGLYIEEKLPKGEKIRVEDHIGSCLYCLNQLTELKELVYFQRRSVPLPSHLLQRIRSLFPVEKRPRKDFLKDIFSPVIQRTFDFFTIPVRQWRYATVSVIAASIAVFITLSIRGTEKEFFRIPKPDFTMLSLRKHEKGFIKVPKLDPNSFVQVSAISSDGKVLTETRGVIIDSQGLIVCNLYPLAGANFVQIALEDGSKYQIRNLWKDEERNIALMKIERKSLPAFPMADLKQIYVGQKVFVVAGPSELKKGVESAIVSDFKSYPSRGASGKVQYIQLASFAAQYTEGALIDQEGKLIGLLITQDKEMKLGAPVKEAIPITREQEPISISELKGIKFSSEALRFYFKGILARDARRNDEAMEFFKKAVELNPDLEGPHLELGIIYYIKRLYDLEIKEYQEVLRFNPNNTDALFNLGEAYETKGLYDLAIKEYEKIITLDPEDAEAYYNLGLAYLTKGQKDKVLKIYSKLKVLDPGFAEKLKRLAKQ